MKSITIRLDDELKAQAETALARLEVSPTQAITHLYLYLAQHGHLPFRLTMLCETPEDVWREAMNKAQAALTLIRSFCQMADGSTEYHMAQAMTPGALNHAADYIATNGLYLQRVKRRFADEKEMGLMLPAVIWEHVSSSLYAAARLITASSAREPDFYEIDATGDLLSQHLTQLIGYFHSPEWHADASLPAEPDKE